MPKGHVDIVNPARGWGSWLRVSLSSKGLLKPIQREAEAEPRWKLSRARDPVPSRAETGPEAQCPIV